MKVTIDAGGRRVEIETNSDANLTHDQVADKALAVWQETSGPPAMEGPAYGFTAQLAGEPARNRWVAEGPPVPVRAVDE